MSADIIYTLQYLTHIGSFRVRNSYRDQKVEYLIPANNIIMLDSYFNLTNKSNLVDRL